MAENEQYEVEGMDASVDIKIKLKGRNGDSGDWNNIYETTRTRTLTCDKGELKCRNITLPHDAAPMYEQFQAEVTIANDRACLRICQESGLHFRDIQSALDFLRGSSETCAFSFRSQSSVRVLRSYLLRLTSQCVLRSSDSNDIVDTTRPTFRLSSSRWIGMSE